MNKENNSNELTSPENFDFPFTPYPIQHEFMENLYMALENKKLGIFESPTGTGKSLSIICGALRWLHDRNSKDREILQSQIEALERKKAELQLDTKDWLNSQAQEIEITHKLNALKLEQKKITDYDTKINELKSKKKKITKKDWKKVDNKRQNENIDNETNILDVITEDLENDNLPEEIDIAKGDSDEENEEEKAYEPIKILICSRTHSQLSQLVGEIIKSPYGSNTRAVSLASRQNYCINTTINRLKNGTLINERCLDLQKKPKDSTKTDGDGKVVKRRKNTSCSCPFYKQTAIEELKEQALLEICDVEDLVGIGQQIKACPYYASRKAAEDAEVILVPYNTLLHKATREANAIKIKNNVVIIDEAHNLLEALGQMYGSEVSLEQLELTSQQLKSYKEKFSSRFSAPNLLCINQLIFIVNKLINFIGTDTEVKANEIKTEVFTVENFVMSAGIDNFNMFKLLKFSRDSKIGQKLHGYSQKNPEIFVKKEPEKKLKGLQQFLSSIENKGKDINNEKKLENTTSKTNPSFGNPFLIFIQFLESLTYSYDDGRVLMYKSKDKKQTKLNFLLLNPAAQFKEIVNEARAVIVAGGTMKPLSEFRDRLFIGAGASPDRIVHFACDHVIPPENILPIIMTKGRNQENLLFNFENRLLMGNVLKDVLQETCRKVIGGIVVFFPSYKYESWVWEQVKDVSFGRLVFREPQDYGSVDSVLDSYATTIRRSGSKGAMLFSVVGGKLSEGINFSDDLGRCVIVTGLPYANINSPELKEKMAYLDKTHGIGSGKNFYEALCIKAVNQCIGRAVRHRNDYATMILLDVRYDRASTKNSLPGWIKRSLKTCDFNQAFVLIEKFFEEKKHIR